MRTPAWLLPDICATNPLNVAVLSDIINWNPDIEARSSPWSHHRSLQKQNWRILESEAKGQQKPTGPPKETEQLLEYHSSHPHPTRTPKVSPCCHTFRQDCESLPENKSYCPGVNSDYQHGPCWLKLQQANTSWSSNREPLIISLGVRQERIPTATKTWNHHFCFTSHWIWLNHLRYQTSKFEPVLRLGLKLPPISDDGNRPISALSNKVLN